MATLIIGGVNRNNHGLLNPIAGIAGYVGLVKVVDECTYKIDIIPGNEDDRADVERMVGQYVLEGFDVKIQD